MLTHIKRVILASQSPRRHDLIQQLKIPFDILVPDIDETPKPEEEPRRYVLRMATEKAESIGEQTHPVLTADTIVVIEGEILQKPLNQADGVGMLLQLSGRTHVVYSAICLQYQGKQTTAVCRSEVTFRAISPAEAEAYWESGEPQDKAGGYAIQGLGATFVQHMTGSYTGIMGLPLFETYQLLQAADNASEH